MFRGVILGAIAVGVGMFAASLLRTEKAVAGDAAADAETEPATGTCAARTRSGASCSRPAEPGSSYCWQHG